MGLIMQVVDVSSVPEEDVQETLTMTAKALENETKCSKLSILLKELGGTLDQDMIPDASLIQGGRVSAIMCKDLYNIRKVWVAASPTQVLSCLADVVDLIEFLHQQKPEAA